MYELLHGRDPEHGRWDAGFARPAEFHVRHGLLEHFSERQGVDPQGVGIGLVLEDGRRTLGDCHFAWVLVHLLFDLEMVDQTREFECDILS